MKKALVLLLIFNFQFSIFNSLRAQDSANVRKGWTFGVLPSFAYDADLGLQLGLLSNVYYFGDGAVYPDYYHSFYVEAATTSKHYGLYRFAYDSKYLIPGHRLSIDLTYLPDQMCDFYGFNGYEALGIAPITPTSQVIFTAPVPTTSSSATCSASVPTCRAPLPSRGTGMRASGCSTTM